MKLEDLIRNILVSEYNLREAELLPDNPDDRNVYTIDNIDNWLRWDARSNQDFRLLSSAYFYIIDALEEGVEHEV